MHVRVGKVLIVHARHTQAGDGIGGDGSGRGERERDREAGEERLLHGMAWHGMVWQGKARQDGEGIVLFSFKRLSLSLPGIVHSTAQSTKQTHVCCMQQQAKGKKIVMEER